MKYIICIILITVTTTVFSQVENRYSNFNTAEEYKAAGDNENALKFYKEFIAQGYEYEAAYLEIYNLYLEKGDIKNAIELINSAREIHPKNHNFILSFIEFHNNFGKISTAIKQLEKEILSSPDDYFLHYVIAGLYVQNNNKKKAEKSYLSSIKLNSDFFDSQFDIGTFHYNNGVDGKNNAQDLEADDAFKVANSKADEHFKIALKYFEKANKIKPKDKQCMKLLVILYAKLKMKEKHEQAKLDYEKL